MYSEEAVTVVRVIKAAQRLGFSLDEIVDLMSVAAPGPGRRGVARPGGLQARVAAKSDEVESRIADLAAIRDTLRTALDGGSDGAVGGQQGLPFADVAGTRGRHEDEGS